MNTHRGNLRRFLATCLIAGFSLDVAGDLPGHPYGVIPAHNPFRLRAMVSLEIVNPPEPPAPPAPKILLTGIVTLSRPRALLQIEDHLTRKTEFPPPLAVGESYDKVSIVEINSENHTVRIRNGNAETTLDFINHGVQPKPVALRVPVPPAAAVRPTPDPMPLPPGMGGYPPKTAPPLKRDVVVDGGRSSFTAPVGPDSNSETRSGRMMTREEVDARIGIEREIRKQNNDPTYKLLPPAR